MSEEPDFSPVESLENAGKAPENPPPPDKVEEKELKKEEDGETTASSAGSIPDDVSEARVSYEVSCVPCHMCAYAKARSIKKFNKKFKKNAAPVLTLMEWRIFPLDEQNRSKGQNYLVCKVWGLTYALLEIKEIENQVKMNESPVAENFAELVGAAELMGVELTKYSSALLEIKTRYHHAICIRDNTRNILRGIAPVLVTLRYDLDTSIILGGKRQKKEDYVSIRAGLRDLQSREWISYRERTDGFFLVSLGLKEVTEDCHQIGKDLKKIAGIFRSGMRWGSIDSVRSTLRWIRRLNVRGLKTGKYPSKVEADYYDKSLNLFQHLIYYAELIGLEAMKLLLTIRLCYIFIKFGNFDHEFCIKLDSYRKVLKKRCRKGIGKIIPWIQFSENDWYQVTCPEALRRVPILIADKYELGLYNEEFQKVKRKLSQIEAKEKADKIMQRMKDEAERIRKEKEAGTKPKLFRSRNKFVFNLRRMGFRGPKSYVIKAGENRAERRDPKDNPVAKLINRN